MKEPFTQVPNALLMSEKLDCYEKLILSLMLMCGKKAFPSYRALMKWSGMSKDKVWKCLKTLEEYKLIQRFSQGRKIYYLTIWNPSDDKVSKMKPVRYTDHTDSQSVRHTDRNGPPGRPESVRQADTINTKDQDLIKRMLANAFSQKEIPKN